MKSQDLRSKRCNNKTIKQDDLKSVDLYSINSLVILQSMKIKTDLTRSYEFVCLPKDPDSEKIKINFNAMENSRIVVKEDVNGKITLPLQMQFIYFGKKTK